MVPAFADIGTVAACTNGMEVLPHHQVFHQNGLAIRALHLHPVRQAWPGYVVFHVRFFTKIVSQKNYELGIMN
jgi:hypothetical protein